MEILDIDAHVKELLTTRLGIPPTDIRNEALLKEDLGLDSVDAIELALKAEKSFAIEMSDRDLESLKTVADITNLVRRLVNGKVASVAS